MRHVTTRRLLGTTAAGLITGLLAGVLPAVSAAADPPLVVISPRCGAADLSWDTGTIGGDESWPTVVLRNGSRINEFTMQSRGAASYGASDGDVFTLQRAGLPEVTLVQRDPEGCAAPQLTVTAVAECAGLRLRLDSARPGPLAGLRLHSALDTGPEGTPLPPLAAGSTDLSFALPDGSPYAVFSGPAGSEAVLWYAGVFRSPDGCTSASPVPPTATAVPSPSAGGPSLPVTGDRTLLIVLIGLGLTTGGLIVMQVARRRRSADRLGAS